MTQFAGAAHRGLGALIIGLLTSLHFLVAHSHASAAVPTHDAALQQPDALAGDTATRPHTEAVRVATQGALIVLELLPGDVADMGLRNEDLPVLLCHLERGGAKLSGACAARSTVNEGPGITGVV